MREFNLHAVLTDKLRQGLLPGQGIKGDAGLEFCVDSLRA